MLTPYQKKLLEFNKKISYKPGFWAFHLMLNDKGDDLRFRCDYKTVCSITGKEIKLDYYGKTKYKKSEVMDLTDEELLDAVRECLIEMETHELDEWFKYSNELVNDPHKES